MVLCVCLWSVPLLAELLLRLVPGLSSTLQSCRADAGMVSGTVSPWGASAEPASFHTTEIKARCPIVKNNSKAHLRWTFGAACLPREGGDGEDHLSVHSSS